MKKIVAVILVVCSLILTAMPAFAAYDASAAVAYASKYYAKSSEKCAGFVSRCLKAGGIDIYQAGTGNLVRDLQACDYATLYKLTVRSQNVYAKDSANAGKVAVGDIIIWWCTKCGSNASHIGSGSTGISPHVAIVSSITDSGIVRYAATNSSAWNKQWLGTYKHSCGRICDVYCFHMAKAKMSETSVTVNGYNNVVVTLGSKTLKNGTDYTLGYACGTTGKVIITINGKNGYIGSRSVTVSVDKVGGLKIDKTILGKYTVRFTGLSKTPDGYQLRYRKSGTSTWTYLKGSSTSLTLDLKALSTYEFQVRAYAKIGTQTCYGAWCTTVKK